MSVGVLKSDLELCRERLTAWLWKNLAAVLQTATSAYEKTSRSWPRVQKPNDPKAALKRAKSVNFSISVLLVSDDSNLREK